MIVKDNDRTMVKLGDLGVVITGSTPKTSDDENYDSNDVCFYKPSDISENRVCYLNSSKNYISELASAKARMIPAGSVLITCIGIIGKVAILENEGTCNQQINAIIPATGKCNNGYLAYCIYYNKALLQAMANAAVVPIINKKQFSEFLIPLPSLETQKQIAAIIDKASQLIKLRKQQLAKMDMLIKSKFIAMFGDPVINPMGWKLNKLGDLGKFKNGLNYNQKDKGYIVKCLGVGDFKNSDIIYDEKHLSVVNLIEKPNDEYFLKNNDIVFVRSNGSKELVGRSVLIDFNSSEVAFSGFCIRIRITTAKLNAMYLYKLLQTSAIKVQMLKDGRGCNITNLNQQILSALAVPVPSLKLQNQFATFVDKVEQQKAVMQASLEKLEINYKSLMQQYFG